MANELKRPRDSFVSYLRQGTKFEIRQLKKQRKECMKEIAYIDKKISKLESRLEKWK